jgi:hypothetical protein
VHLALPRLVCSELPLVFREFLRRGPARARLLRCSVSAVRRSAAVPAAQEVVGLDGPVGAAQQQLRDGVGFALPRGIEQRRVPARPTAAAATRPAHSSADSPRAQTAHPSSSWAFTSASASASDRTIRRLPSYAAQCSAVMPCLCTAGPGWWGGPHGGTSVPNRYPKHKTSRTPRGSTMVSHWVTVNDREYSREDSAYSPSRTPLARIHQTCQTSESRRNGDCGRRRRREIRRLGKTAGERTSHGT